MEAGIFIFILLLVGIGAVVAFFFVGGAAAVGEAAEGRGRRGRRRRPEHLLAEPRDEQAAGYGVGQEHGTPQPARVQSAEGTPENARTASGPQS
jgi:hypothetical protein